MNETLDHDYICNYGIDEFNTELLLNPSEIASNEYLRSMEIENPSLPILCPLAKGIYYLGRSGIREHVLGALRDVMLIDPNRSERPAKEFVNHIIIKSSGEHNICLGFQSQSEFIWATGEDESGEMPGIQVGTLEDSRLSGQVTKEALIQELFRIAQEQDHVSLPMGEPVDDGEFVCFLSYRLCSVNEFQLKQTPEILYSTHDLQFVVSDHRNSISWPENESEEFEWPDLLCEEDKEIIFRQTPHLASLLDGADPDLKKCRMLTVDEIHQSYKDGSVVIESQDRLQVVIGFGAEWSPELCIVESLNDNAIEDDIAFPSRQPPLIGFTLPANSNSRKKDFERAFPALKLLLDACLSVE